VPEILAVAFEALSVLLALGGALVLMGYGLTRLLAPAELRPYAWLLTPVIGAAALVVGSYALNLVMDLRWSTAVLLACAAALAVWCVWRRRPGLPPITRVQALVAGCAVVLLIVAFAPHLQNRSLAMLGLNIDEELYVPLAELLKGNTAFMSGVTDSPFQVEFQSERNHARGWGFPYLLGAATILSNAPAFHAYAPTLYLLLALSVLAVFIFGRTGLGMSERTAAMGAGLYALHGLPLWFTGMGFGPHAVSFLLFPAALATALPAIRAGGRRTISLAGVVNAALLVSYFWAISAVYLVVAAALLLALVGWGGGRLPRLRNAVVLAAAIALLGAPGLTWLVRWASPMLMSIMSNLNAQFGNAWGDTTFVPYSVAFGLAPYHLAADAGPLGAALGATVFDAWRSVRAALLGPSVVLALFGLVTLRGRRLVAIPLAVAYAAFLVWVERGAAYPYGHLKNMSYITYFVTSLLASGISNLYHGRAALWGGRAWMAPPRIARWWRGLGLAITLVMAVALAQNTTHTVWWYWSGLGWNVDRRIAHDARAVADRLPAGSRVYFADGLTYPLLGERIVLRDHVLGFHFPEHQRERWAARARSVWMGVLQGRSVYGFAYGLAFGYERFDHVETYDALVLNSTDDPRTFGLLPADARYVTPYWTLYQTPRGDQLTANQLAAANRGRLALDAERGLRFGEDGDRLGAGDGVAPARGAVVFGVLTAEPATLAITLDGHEDRVAVAPGLSWVTTGTPARSDVWVRPTEAGSSVQLVAARRAAPGSAPRVERVPRHVVGIDAWVDGQTLRGRIITFNPTGAGGNVGISFQEAGSHGFWPSQALAAAPVQRLDFTYDPVARTLQESLNGAPPVTQQARMEPLAGSYKLTLRLARGFIDELEAQIATYTAGPAGPANVILFRRTYVFDLPVGP